MLCEYDGSPLPLRDGLPDACPECESDLQQHEATCATCRAAPNLPDIVNLEAVLGAL